MHQTYTMKLEIHYLKCSRNLRFVLPEISVLFYKLCKCSYFISLCAPAQLIPVLINFPGIF